MKLTSTPQRQTKRSGPLFGRLIYFSDSLQCSWYFWERAKVACYLYVAYVRNAVAAILNLILLLRKIATGESSIPWNRSLRAKTEDGVSGGPTPAYFFKFNMALCEQNVIMRTPKKTPTIHWATDSSIYNVILL